MDLLEGLGWSGLITVMVSVIWNNFLPLSNLLILSVYIACLLLGSFWEGAKEVPKIFQHNFARPIIEGTASPLWGIAAARMIPQSGELITSWHGDCVFTVFEPQKYANQMKLFNPITSGLFSGLTGKRMDATG